MVYTNTTISAGILTGTATNPVAIDFIAKAGGSVISYMEWLKYGFPPAALMTVIAWALLQVMYKPERSEVPGGAAQIARKLAELGPMSNAEKRTLLYFVLVVILWATGAWTKIDSTIAALCGAVLLMIPKYGVINWKEAEKGISWQLLMVTGGGMSLGGVLSDTGAAKFIALSLFQGFGFQSLSVIMLLIVVLVIVQYLHIFFVGSTVMVTALMPIVLSIADTAGLPPALIGMPACMIVGGYPLLMFYNTLPSVMAYDTGKITVLDFPKPGFIVCAIACIVYAICAMTYWKWLSLYVATGA
jgi:anion transporter